jgi:hypothetical protein
MTPRVGRVVSPCATGARAETATRAAMTNPAKGHTRYDE